MNWKDITTYSQNDKERIPRIWHINVGPFRVSVHRHRHYEPDQWLLSTVPALFDCELLSSGDLEEAKCQALAKLQVACQETIDEIIEVKK